VERHQEDATLVHEHVASFEARDTAEQRRRRRRSAGRGAPRGLPSPPTTLPKLSERGSSE
jgi:hypothetical protein